jgi:hypothetical protein
MDATQTTRLHIFAPDSEIENERHPLYARIGRWTSVGKPSSHPSCFIGPHSHCRYANQRWDSYSESYDHEPDHLEEGDSKLIRDNSDFV